MNKSNLKSYAPQARKDFIAAVTARAHQLGFTSTHVNDATVRGDVLIIDGVEWPAKVAGLRAKLLDKILHHGFEQTMEEVAYTWFNRFAALRYMELHDFLEHGHRVLSSRDGGLPELLRHAASVSLPGLQAAKVQEMQLAGNRDDELYKALLVAQCNELSRVMPFLFERIDDETELLLPDNLLRTDSIVAKLVAGVPEEDWQEIEVIGWLYQFYISEKKDQVIGKVVKSEDIPAATQLFTPNWIVQYLVQNSVGRLWLMANPQSTLASEWPYYITPAEQTPEVQAQLDALIQTRVADDGDTLNPESITVLDPACGSGHILVVAYDVLKAIYVERGYRVRDIPRLILEKNLYGLDIDDRAAQMAGFALLMKARADDRRLFTAADDAGNLQPPKLNVLSLQESKGLNVDELTTHLAPHQVQRATIAALVEAFEHAKTFGSLIQIPYALKTHLTVLPRMLAKVRQSGDMYASAAADDLMPLVQQAQVLAMQFDSVVANPPYMGGKGMNPALKDYAKGAWPDSKSDLFAMFIERGFEWCKPSGLNSMVTMQSWMFLSSYEAMRQALIVSRTIFTLAHFGPRAFAEISGEVVQTVAFVFAKSSVKSFRPKFFRLIDGQEEEKRSMLLAGRSIYTTLMQEEFLKIPSSPIAYWLSVKSMQAILNSRPLTEFGEPRVGLDTGNNAIFVRSWQEVDYESIGFGFTDSKSFLASDRRYVPHTKGGEYKKWYGNLEYVLKFDQDAYLELENSGNKLPSRQYYFRKGASWTRISTSGFSIRVDPIGCVFNSACPTIFADETNLPIIVSFLHSAVATYFLKIFSPTLNFQAGEIRRLPLLTDVSADVITNFKALMETAVSDWNSNEISWNFEKLPMVSGIPSNTLSNAYIAWNNLCSKQISAVRAMEEQNNRIFINAYGLQDELSPEVPESQITLARADREKDCQRLISYAIGCMMGRYSLDEPGLIYAHAGNVGFDASRYTRFAADADGILPITDEHWFDDDAPARVRDFLQVVWGPETLAENMAWLAESLGGKASETPEETIRRYMADKFYKDHLQTYKKRPIYWLFSSGKQGAFQALVYLHRYNEGTLSRMRAEYVIPLTAKLAARLEMLEQDANAASSAAARTKIRKQIEGLRKKQVELLSFDEKLRHHADMRITLDLDDGVKVNYGKFGDLLDSVKVVTGGGSDD
ncbi:SAM-dependent methyltransferase [Limnohabitans sp. TS-CS-82]|uniref:BREX-1 system adenine-specific DNA-methyltransferase PglX n=1 Tax=Limnohabitans sp. TS-CS-82 TaxID=2094193 RepID=UPI000CF2D942|nr:BREX-1 system adenine-specific DNA-methyltransferase PglX [Limnohabitans sp. TS-CS-82]PQA81932.1 SAM-dependent methyltransferase [Limnohabitans sp. TS-CS-82]